MPNTFAQLVLASWPVVALVAFGAMKPARAVSAALIAGYLLLPERAGWDFPLIPAINKTMIINVSAAIVAYAALRREKMDRLGARPDVHGRSDSLPTPDRSLAVGSSAPGARVAVEGFAFRFVAFLIVLSFAVPFVTVMTNMDSFVIGLRYFRPMALYDSVSLMISVGISLVPLMLGMRLLGTPGAHKELLSVLVCAALAYSLLVLFEARMSPQLSRWMYGFFPHSWVQHIRGGAFRPVVFLHHGLWLGIFLSMSTLACCALWRQAVRDRVLAAPWLVAWLWMGMTLFLSRNLGATALMLAFAPVILFAPVRLQIAAAAAVSVVVLAFPMLRGAGWVPVDVIIDLAAMVDGQRADSLRFRLDNEDILLERANERPLAGWGTWGRGRVYDESGNDVSITDGMWILTIGSFGWIGYLAQFGLLAVPSLLLFFRRSEGIAPVTSGLAVVLAVAFIDLIPNATLTPVTWLLAGALAGVAIRSWSLAPANPEVSLATGNVSWRAKIAGSASTPPVLSHVATGDVKGGATPIRHHRSRRV
jgi:hypothetical protein